MQETWSIAWYLRKVAGKNALNSVVCVAVNVVHIRRPVMVLVNTATLSCTSLPHSSVIHLTALSACSA